MADTAVNKIHGFSFHILWASLRVRRANHPTAPPSTGHERNTYDAKANVAQFDAYLPYGELLVDEHTSTEEMPYKFNGKEFDEETRLYYYGARYMNPRTSLWYGVDPLAEKYPNITPYCYTDNNPVRYIDPNGMIKREYFDYDNMNNSGHLFENYAKFKDGGENVFNFFAHGNGSGFS